MPQGLEVYREDGTLLVGIDDRVIRVVTVGNAGSGGSFTDLNNLVNVTAAMMVASTGQDMAVPTFSHDGTTASWSWGSGVPTDKRDTTAGFSILVM